MSDGHEPLPEPAVLVSTNCETCRGTGFLVQEYRGGGHYSVTPWQGRDPLTADVPRNTVPCGDCDASGRVVQEVPLSEFMQMAQAALQRTTAEPPSLLG